MLPESKLIEVIDLLFDILYEDKKLFHIDIDLFLKEYANLELSQKEKWLFIKQLTKTNMAYRIHSEEGIFSNNITLTDEALEIIYSHGKYSIYLSEIKLEEEKRQKEEVELKKLDKRTKISSNWNSISAVVYGAIGIFLTIMTLIQQSHLNQLDSKTKEQNMKMDSILRAIENLQKLQ